MKREYHGHQTWKMIRNHITGLGVVVVREATQATAEASRCATSRQRPPTSSSHPAPSPRLAREALVLRHSSTSTASPSPYQGCRPPRCTPHSCGGRRSRRWWWCHRGGGGVGEGGVDGGRPDHHPALPHHPAPRPLELASTLATGLPANTTNNVGPTSWYLKQGPRLAKIRDGNIPGKTKVT